MREREREREGMSKRKCVCESALFERDRKSKRE